jgi:hypothetical protein
MRTMLCLIPYLAIPLILPDLTTGYRLLAFLAVFLIAGYQLYIDSKRETSSAHRISPFHGVILLEPFYSISVLTIPGIGISSGLQPLVASYCF